MSVVAAPGRDTRLTILEAGRDIMARRGFSAVGLTEILAAAGVPKGSFYHYFGSKDAFGVAMLDDYFDGYVAEIADVFGRPGLTMAEKLMLYFSNWRGYQNAFECQGRCLAVKLGAEVSDLSEPMRLSLKAGTDRIVALLAGAVESGVAEGSIRTGRPAAEVAASLYHQWLGASVMVKILRTEAPFDTAVQMTRQTLGTAGR